MRGRKLEEWRKFAQTWAHVTNEHAASSDLSESGQVVVNVTCEAGVCRGLVALLGQRRRLPVHQMETGSHLGGQVDVGRMGLVIRLQRKTQQQKTSDGQSLTRCD